MDNLRAVAQAKSFSLDGTTDFIWVFDGPHEKMATISPIEPTEDKGFRPLVALMAHLSFSEWEWFDQKG